MREKLLALMKSEGLKSSQLAELLAINPAGISHILAGRNKPGFDLLQKILRCFPDISPDWLLLDAGPMYREAGNAAPHSPTFLSGRLNPEQSNAPLPIGEGLFSQTSSENDTSPTTEQTQSSAKEAPVTYSPETLPLKADGAKVSRVVIFYEDQTFESFAPKTR